MAGRHRWAALRAAIPVASRSVRAARRQRRMICLPLHFALFPVLVAGSGVVPGAGSAQQVVRVPLSGTIEMGLAPFVERTLAEAVAAGADAVVLEIETPGGRVDAAERIANAIGRSPVPVHAWVNMHAYSAGAMIAIATDRIFMQPGAVIGAATPVDGSGARPPRRSSRPCGPRCGRWPRPRGATRWWPRRWWTRGSRSRVWWPRANCSP